MLNRNFYDRWIANTKKPHFRSAKLKTLDQAIQRFCASLPLLVPTGNTRDTGAEKALLDAWDDWQQSKAISGGWWNSDRRKLSGAHILIELADELLEQMQARTREATVGVGPVCYDSPHLSRDTMDGAEKLFTLSPLAREVWDMSRRRGLPGDSFIGITQRSTGICHMLPTYEQVAAGTLTDESIVKNRIFTQSPERTVRDIYETFGRPPKFGSKDRKVIIAPPGPIDGYYHNTLIGIVRVGANDALGWALQGCPAHRRGFFRFVSSKNSNVFDLGNGAGHESRDLPPAWAKAISDCVARGLGLNAEQKFSPNVSGKGDATWVRNFTC